MGLLFCHRKLPEKLQAECDGQWQNLAACGVSVLLGGLAMGWALLSVEPFSALQFVDRRDTTALCPSAKAPGMDTDQHSATRVDGHSKAEQS